MAVDGRITSMTLWNYFFVSRFALTCRLKLRRDYKYQTKKAGETSFDGAQWRVRRARHRNRPFFRTRSSQELSLSLTHFFEIPYRSLPAMICRYCLVSQCSRISNSDACPSRLLCDQIPTLRYSAFLANPICLLTQPMNCAI